MKFIKKKNLREGEELLYTPQLHWFFVVKPLLYSLPFFALLLVIWFTGDSLAEVSDQMGYELWLPVQLMVRQTFLAGLLVILVVFLCRILQFITTEYGVTSKRLLIKKGVLRLTTAEIPTDRIESIYCTQGILGRIFHYGTMGIAGIGGNMPVFYMVARPYGLRRKIVDIIERNKNITVVHGDLPKVKPAAKQAEKDEPLYRYGTFVRVLQDNSQMLPDSDFSTTFG
ncbi:MAG: PH domain-containing protein [Treponema sp.]|nr:PH domain-containing protein [Treponema sp.]